MDHIKVLKRAFEVTWRYRALWVFGIVLALTVAILYPPNSPSNPPPSQSADGEEARGRWEQIAEEHPEWIDEQIGEQIGEWIDEQIAEQLGTTVAVVAVVTTLGVCCLCVPLGLALRVAIHGVRCVMETSLIRMVDDYEETGEKRTVMEGLRMGWSRSAFQILLIDLLVWLFKFAIFAPLVVLGLLSALIVALIFVPILVLLFSTGSVFGIVFGIVVSVLVGVALLGILGGALFLLGVLGFIVELVLQALKSFFYRICVLEKTGVFDAISQGVSFFRRHLFWDIVIMLLIVLGLYLGWFVVTFFVMVIVMPIVIFVALTLSAIPVLLVGLVGYLTLGGVVPWILGSLIAIPVFVLVVAAPILFWNGLGLTFLSTLWTLTYRELRALEGLEGNTDTTDTDISDLE